MRTPIPDEDRSLVDLARSGNSGAREALAHRVGDAAYLFALHLTRDRDAARDIAQDAVLRFFTHLDRFDTSQPIDPWLYQIVRNRVRDVARRSRIRKHESLDGIIEGAAGGSSSHLTSNDTTTDPQEQLERVELQRSIWRAVAMLSDDHREIFILRDFHGFSYREIAEIVSIPQGTVMSRLHTARVRLRSLLTEREDTTRTHEEHR